MAFRFSLATVLRYRESIEEREERALQKFLLEIARIRHEIEQLTAGIAAKQQERYEAMQQPLPAFHLQTMLSEIDAALERRKALTALLEELERQRKKQMQIYQAAARDRKMLSDIFTRQRDAYEQERARTLQKFLDDIFVTRALRS
ncbi:MAG: flagellar FliJ family protein [Terracidiphilus sp.]